MLPFIEDDEDSSGEFLDKIETSLIPTPRKTRRAQRFRRPQHPPNEIRVDYEVGKINSYSSRSSFSMRRRVLSDGDIPIENKTIATPIVQERVLSLDERDSSLVPSDPYPSSPLSSLMSVSNWIPRPAPDDCLLQIPVLSSDNYDDDERSISFFHPDDFDSDAWKKVVKSASTYGLVVAALATAVTHPIVFVVAALAVAGGASVMHSEDDIRSWFGLEPKSPATSESPPGLTEESSHSVLSIPDELPLVLETATTASTALGHDNIVNYYPKMTNDLVQSTRTFIGLSALDVFHVFFADEAPYNFRLLQEQRGDIDIDYGKWKSVESQGPLSFMPKSVNAVLPSDSYISFQTRKLCFKAKTNNFFGPPYATTTKVQRMMITSKKLAVLESETRLADIPFCDRFYIIERWVVTASKKMGRYDSSLQASCEIVFTASCPFESQIKSKSATTITDVANAWCEMATAALQLAEKAKNDRITESVALKQ